MPYIERPIPADALPWRVREAERLRDWLRNDTIEDAGILRWKTNGHVVPSSTYRDAYCDPPIGSEQIERQEADAFLAEYRAMQIEHDEETLAEMRAAFGEGTTVVNILTGHRTRL